MALTRRLLLQRMGLVAPVAALAPVGLARRVYGAKAEGGEGLKATRSEAASVVVDARRDGGVPFVFYGSDGTDFVYTTLGVADVGR